MLELFTPSPLKPSLPPPVPLTTAISEPEGIKINSLPTKLEGQETGTSGLRQKDIMVLMVHVQPLFNSLPPKEYKIGDSVLGGDDPYFNLEAAQESETEGANHMVEYLSDLVSWWRTGDKYGNYVLQFADDFTYTDPVDGSMVSKQGVRFVFTDGSRIIFRSSGTGSAGATVRMCIEQLNPMFLNINWMPKQP